jgi:hypothetical protein
MFILLATLIRRSVAVVVRLLWVSRARLAVSTVGKTRVGPLVIGVGSGPARSLNNPCRSL